MRWSPRLAMALIVLLATACSPASEPPVPEPANEPEPSNGPIDTTTDPAQPSDEPTLPGEDELTLIWTEFLATWFDQAAAEQPDPAAFENLTIEPEVTVEALTLQRGDARLVTPEFEPWTRIDTADDRAEISDCAIVTQHPDGQPDSLATVTISWEATAIATDDGWLIDTARPGELFCIAEELNDQLLASYTTWLEAHGEWYEPPDPEHPLLALTMAEPGLSDMRDALASDRDEGITMRFPHDTQPVVTDLAPDTARVTDCYLAPDSYGAFDVDSGERRSDIVPDPEPGQMNRTVADLELSNHGWRVIGWRWEEQNDCEPRETRYVPR